MFEYSNRSIAVKDHNNQSIILTVFRSVECDFSQYSFFAVFLFLIYLFIHGYIRVIVKVFCTTQLYYLHIYLILIFLTFLHSKERSSFSLKSKLKFIDLLKPTTN